MKLEAQDRLQSFDDENPVELGTEECEDDEETIFSVNVSDGCVREARFGEDLVPEEVWKRSTTLSGLVKMCLEQGINGSGPIELSHEDLMAWVRFSGKPETDKTLCDILSV